MKKNKTNVNAMYGTPKYMSQKKDVKPGTKKVEEKKPIVEKNQDSKKTTEETLSTEAKENLSTEGVNNITEEVIEKKAVAKNGQKQKPEPKPKAEPKPKKPEPEIKPELKKDEPKVELEKAPITEIKTEKPSGFGNTHFETVICFEQEMIIGYNISVAKEYAAFYNKNVFLVNDDSDIFTLDKFRKQGYEILPYQGISNAKKGSVVCVENKGLSYSEIINYICKNTQDCLVMFCGLNMTEKDILEVLKKSKDGSGVDLSVNVGIMTSLSERLMNRSNIFRFHHDPIFRPDKAGSYIDKYVRNTNKPELVLPMYISQLIFEMRYMKNVEIWNAGEDEFAQLTRISNPVYFDNDNSVLINCTYDEFRDAGELFLQMMQPSIEASGDQMPTVDEIAMGLLPDDILPKSVLDEKMRIVRMVQSDQNNNQQQQQQQQQQVQPPKPEDKEPETNPLQQIVEELIGESLDDEPVETVIENTKDEVAIEQYPELEIIEQSTEMIDDNNGIMDVEFEGDANGENENIEPITIDFNIGDTVSVKPLKYDINEQAVIIDESSNCKIIAITEIYGLCLVEHKNGFPISEFVDMIDTIEAEDLAFSETCRAVDDTKRYAIAPFDTIIKQTASK